MRKITFFLLMTVSVFVFNSCEDEDISGTEFIDYASFGEIPSLINVIKGSSTSVEIHLYTTQISGSDRTFNLVVETTLDPSSYSMPSTIVVPANTNDGMIEVTFSDTNLGENPESFSLKLDPTSDVFKGEIINTTIQKLCPIVLTDFVGTWTGDNGYGDTEITTRLNSNGNIEITGVGVEFMTVEWGEVIIEQTWIELDINMDTGAFSFPETYYMTTTYNGAVQTAYNLIGTGIIEACNGVMDLDYDFIQGGTSYTAWLTVGNGYPPFEEFNTLSN